MLDQDIVAGLQEEIKQSELEAKESIETQFRVMMDNMQLIKEVIEDLGTEVD